MRGESNLAFCFFKPSQNQSDSTYISFNQHLHITTLVGSIIICTLVLLSNLMLIYGLYRTTKRPMSTTKKFFIYLSCTDTMTVIIGVSRHILSYHLTNCKLLLGLDTVSDVFFCLGMATFSTISVLRYLSLRNPFMRVGKGRMKLILLVEMTASMMIIGFSHYSIFNDDARNVVFIIQLFIIITYLLSVTSLLMLNLLSYITLKANIKHGVAKTKTNEQSGNGNLQNTPDVTKSNFSGQWKNKRKKDAVNTLIIISVFYMICHLPFGIYLFFAAVNGLQVDDELNFGNTYQISSLLLFVSMSNNGFNATILIIRSRDILSVYKLMIIGNTFL